MLGVERGNKFGCRLTQPSTRTERWITLGKVELMFYHSKERKCKRIIRNVVRNSILNLDSEGTNTTTTCRMGNQLQKIRHLTQGQDST